MKKGKEDTRAVKIQRRSRFLSPIKTYIAPLEYSMGKPDVAILLGTYCKPPSGFSGSLSPWRSGERVYLLERVWLFW